MKTKEKTVINDQQQSVSDSKKGIAKKIKKIKIPKLRLQTRTAVILSLVLVTIISIALVFATNNGDRLTTVSKSSLQKVLEINELSTVKYTYNATATKYDNNNNAMYYVAYEGRVDAGIDFNKIKIDIKEKEKKVIITVPEVEIHGIEVEMGTMEFIFTKDKYETEKVSEEAYKLCISDLESRIGNESVLHDTARENAKSSVEALFKPWIDTIDDSYTIEIK